jgi:hypothetical protein
VGWVIVDDELRAIARDIQRLRKRQNVLLLIVCVMIVWLTRLTFAGDVEIAIADRQQFQQSDWPYIYYFGTGHLPQEQHEQLTKILCFAICSLNDRVVIEQQLPTPVNGLQRIDTRALGWQQSLPKMLAKHYPYSRKPGVRPLVIRADWFVQFTLDQEVGGDEYYRLLFGQAPRDLNGFLKLLQADIKSEFAFGHIEDASGVSVSGTRLVTSVPTATRSDVWITYDVAELNRQTDPLEHLDQKFKHDASEIIGAMPKSLSSTGEIGHLQVYALANAAGQLQSKAPADVVVDSNQVRGVEIRNPVSCISCHVEGLRPLKINSLRQFIASGAEAYADYRQREKIERFHLTSLATLITRYNEDYETAVKAINGYTAAENAAAFASTIRRYDEPITLTRAAMELYMPVEEFKLALGYGGDLPARIAQLAQGLPIPRSTWESEYRTVYYRVQNWQRANRNRVKP